MKFPMTHVPFKLFLILVLAAILRIVSLDRYPPALYSDEVSQGYNAFSILKTGRDEFGVFLPVSLRAFGEWKPALATYLMIPTIAAFGLNEWGVRLPSAALGALTVVLIYFIVRDLLKELSDKNVPRFFTDKQIQVAALSAALFLAISPWHILQSRSAMHGSVTLFFMTLFVWSFIHGVNSGRFLYLAGFSLAMTMYSYYSLTAIGLGTLLIFIRLFRKKLKAQFSHLVWSAIFGILLLAPLTYAAYKQPDVLIGRARYVSVFYDRGVSLTVWDLIAQDGGKMLPLVTQFFHNKEYQYLIDINRRFFQHLEGSFLFLQGDRYPPFQIPGMGILYLADISGLFFGLVFLQKHMRRLLLFLSSLVFITVLPSALTFLTPSTNRMFLAIPPLTIITAIGLTGLMVSNRPRQTRFLAVSTYTGCVFYFCFQYFIVLPSDHADWWYYGQKELVQYLSSREHNIEKIVISGKIGVPYIFQLFYRGSDPGLVRSQLRRNYTKDDLGFEHVDGLGKYEFPRYFTWDKDIKAIPANSLLVLRADEYTDDMVRVEKYILYPDGRVAYKVLKL